MTRWHKCLASLATGAALCAASAVSAETEELTVKVDARTMPWSGAMNRKLAFGLGDGRPPVLVWDVGIHAGNKLHFTVTGQTNTIAGGAMFGPNGEADWTNDRGGFGVFPSYYMDHKNGPIHLNQLVGAFVDADGHVVGKPFAIGESATIEVADGAAALALGLNDDKYNDNAGSLTVNIRISLAKVTVEDGHAD